MTIVLCKFPLEESMGGAELHSLALAQYWQSRGHSVRLLSSDRGLLSLFQQNKIPNQYLFMGWEPTSKLSLLLWPATCLLARFRLRGLKKNLLRGNVFFLQSLTEKLVLTPFLLSKRVGVVWMEHKVPGKWLTQSPLLGRYLRQAKKISMVVVSEYAKQQFERIGVPSGNIMVIYPGAPLSAGPRVSPEQFTIGFLCRLHPEKGIVRFLENLAPLIRDKRDWKILIAGRGPEEKAVRELVLRLRIANQVRLLGFVNNKEGFFSQISVLAYPTVAIEAFGMAALEAHACGVPVVATDAGGLREIIQHGQTGFLVKPNDWQEWERCFLELADKHRAEIVGTAAKQGSRGFSMQRMWLRFDSVLRAQRNL